MGLRWLGDKYLLKQSGGGKMLPEFIGMEGTFSKDSKCSLQKYRDLEVSSFKIKKLRVEGE